MASMSAEPASPLEVQMARLEGSYEQINLRLSSLEGQIAEIRGDIRGLRADTDTKFDKLDRRIDARFNLIALLGALLVVLQVLSAIDVI